MTTNIYNTLILLGGLHGLILSVLLLFSRRNSRPGNILLAMVLVFYTLPVLRVALIDMSFFRHYNLSIFSIELLYGLGPSLYLYVKFVSDPKYRFRRTDFLHFLPVLAELIYYLSPYYYRADYYTIGPAQSGQHIVWMLEQGGTIVSILIYLVISNKLLWSYSHWVKGNFSHSASKTLRWLQVPLFLYSSFFAMWLGLRSVDVAFFHDSMALNYYYPLLLFLSFSSYWIGTKGYLRAEVDTVGFSKSRQEKAPVFDEETLAPIYRRLESLMSVEKLYLDGELSLSQLAERLEINPRLLSRVINTTANMNFYDFVNRYRVEELKRLMTLSETTGTLLNLAYECGFSSKATFNHVFKKLTGLTPTQYAKKVSEVSSTVGLEQ